MSDVRLDLEDIRGACTGLAIIAFVCGLVGYFYYLPLLFAGIGAFLVALIIGQSLDKYITDEIRDQLNANNRLQEN